MLKIKALHYCVIPESNNNAGDNLLYELIRKVIDFYMKDIRIKWITKSQWEVSTAEEINNLKVDFVLFGGGGLFLPDQEGARRNNNTGWQIDIPEYEYKNIRPFYFGTAIGFNWFRNCKYKKEIIKKSAKNFIEHSEGIGIRNYGSIVNIKKITQLDNGIYWLPCPTTFLCKLSFLGIDNELKSLEKDYLSKNRNYSLKKKLNIAINLSCDRLEQRNLKKSDFIKLRPMIEDLINDGHKIKYLAHKNIDLIAYEIIGSKYFKELINIASFSKKEIIQEYSKFDCVLGGRGHSLMIPIGLSIPVISLTSHDKQKFFMQDLKLNEFSLEIADLSGEEIKKNTAILIKEINSQYKFINDYQNLALDAWRKYVEKIYSKFK